MKRVVVDHYGGPEVLKVVEDEDPRPGPGEVRVRVLAAGVSYTDAMLRVGSYLGVPKPPFTPGYELVGVVEELGPGCSRLRVGDRIGTLTVWGADAERVCVRFGRRVAGAGGYYPVAGWNGSSPAGWWSAAICWCTRRSGTYSRASSTSHCGWPNRSPSRSGVGIGSGIAAGDAYGQPLEVEVPAGPVVVALLVRGQVVVAQDDRARPSAAPARILLALLGLGEVLDPAQAGAPVLLHQGPRQRRRLRCPGPRMAPDLCRHCAEAACRDVCPTGPLFRTESGTSRSSRSRT